MIFIDTNYFLRLVLADEKAHYQQAKKLLQSGALGKLKLFTSVVVFFEIYWVLTSFYKKKKKEVTRILSDLLRMKFIKWQNREILEEALEIYEDSALDLEDSFNLSYARAKRATDFKSFDKKLMRVITR
jgi:predicted nucleic-acid-binding protein